jgi:hypothetical protein
MDNDTLTYLFAAAMAVSEVLALIPGLKANSIFQAIVGILKMLTPTKTPKDKT